MRKVDIKIMFGKLGPNKREEYFEYHKVGIFLFFAHIEPLGTTLFTHIFSLCTRGIFCTFPVMAPMFSVKKGQYTQRIITLL